MSDTLSTASSINDAIAKAMRIGLAIYDSPNTAESDLADQVQQLAATLGRPYGGRAGAIVESLSPLREPAAARNSLSACHGVGRFPWHTDTAHRQVPARWVVMACVDTGSVQACTEILRWNSLELTNAKVEMCSTKAFAFVNGRNSFLSTITQSDRGYIRFDPGCMRALDREGANLLSELAEWTPEGGESLHIEWNAGRVIIFDNWKCLHRRHDASAAISRKLLRAYAA